MSISRRQFLRGATTAALFTAVSRAPGSELRLLLGIQLYSVREQMAVDFEGTLAALRNSGYVEVESAALPKRSAKEIRRALDAAGLKCVSAHQGFGELHNKFDEVVAFDQAIGARSIICPSPGRRTPLPDGISPPPNPTLDDWRYSAEQFNRIGEKLRAAGLHFGYHNHTAEFASIDGVAPYMELMRLCEPDKVFFELDCGWARVAGVDPVALMREHPQRFKMLHIKDFKLPPHPTPESREGCKVVELGRGDIDYRPILDEAARTQSIEHMFVEQEAFTLPWKESIAVDAAYLKKLGVC